MSTAIGDYTGSPKFDGLNLATGIKKEKNIKNLHNKVRVNEDTVNSLVVTRNLWFILLSRI